ncbi:MAG: sulfite reductase subunit alpha [Thiohalocapsa sp.]
MLAPPPPPTLPAVPPLPETAPFTPAQRAWLDGWLAGFCATPAPAPPVALPLPAETASAAAAGEPGDLPRDLPWHDMSLPLDERLALAAGRPLPQRLMAAMAQQDCGQCGYLCDSYAAAIADGSERSLVRCVPGGRETARALKELLAEGGLSLPAAPRPAAAMPAPQPPGTTSEVAAAPLASAIVLNRAGSQKETRHLMFDLAGTGLAYEVGDVLGVQPENCPQTVAAVIALLGACPDDAVDCPDGTRKPLHEALLRCCDIARVGDEAVEVLASRAPDLNESQRLQALAEGYPGAEPEGADLLELLQTFRSARPPVQELVSALAPLQPRLYSIASSPKLAGTAVDLTVATVRYERRGRRRSGVASGYLADRVAIGSAVPVFIRKAHDFRLPDDDDMPLVMIGPGTGIAPFRAFLQERLARGARGRNWLFFGDQRRACDFLYEEELMQFRRAGLLDELEVAFSRDQPERIYVQQRMRERGRDLWGWLEEGARLCICGAAQMARDVDAALAAIIARQGGMTTAAAKAYLAAMLRDKRYLRDVY